MSPSGEQGIAEPTHLVEQASEETLAVTQGLVMVDFWAAGSGPCRAIAPVLEERVEASEGRPVLMEVKVAVSPPLAARDGMRSSPTLLFLKEGALVDRMVGAAPEAVPQGIVNARAS